MGKLFGKKKDKHNDSNPHAQVPEASDPYAIDYKKHEKYGGKPSPYEQAKQAHAPPASAAAQQRQNAARPNGPTSSHSQGPPPSYRSERHGSSQGPPPSYGSDRHGTGGGYGANRFDSGSQHGGSPAPSRGGGGYGGLGRSNSMETVRTEDNRNALFGEAKERQAKKDSMPADDAQQNGGYGENSGMNGDGGDYGAYDDRHLTAEEEENEDVEATKQQMRFMKQEDIGSTRNAIRIANQAEETGRSTLSRLGGQGERIHNTEKNLDLAANHNRQAEEKARELKTLNKSMFAVHVANPFTTSKRKAARDQSILDKHREEREERDATRKEAFGTQQRMEGAFKSLQPGDPGYRSKPPSKANLAERAKYQFEADSEDDEMENEIDNNLDDLHGAAGRLNLLARTTGDEVDVQNKHIDRITQKSDRVDDQILMNRARLDRIH